MAMQVFFKHSIAMPSGDSISEDNFSCKLLANSTSVDSVEAKTCSKILS